MGVQVTRWMEIQGTRWHKQNGRSAQGGRTKRLDHLNSGGRATEGELQELASAAKKLQLAEEVAASQIIHTFLDFAADVPTRKRGRPLLFRSSEQGAAIGVGRQTTWCYVGAPL